jgi:hypothetical protein
MGILPVRVRLKPRMRGRDAHATISNPRDASIEDRDVPGFDFAGENIDDPPVSQHQIGWRVPAGDG